jgi:F-type H+-transporting ATPase subunit a
MGLEFLARIRRTTLIATAVASLFAAVYASYAAGLALAAGALWSIANLRLLEAIVTSITSPAPSPRRAALAIAGNVALLALGGVLLWKLPVMVLAMGFALPFAVLGLKAASQLLLASALWRRLTASPWRSAALVLALATAAWLGGGALERARAQSTREPAAAAQAAPLAHTAPEAKAKSGGMEFPNVIALILERNESQPWAHALIGEQPDHEATAKRITALASIGFSLLAALLLSLLCVTAARSRDRVPKGLANVVEMLVEMLHDFVCSILGRKYGTRYTPFLGSLFLYIWFMNMFGLLPFMASPTSNLNVTLALALTVVVYVQFTAIRELSFIGWIDHLAGSPRSAIEWGLVPLMLPIHIIGEIAKPVSLSCRLFGNIFGEDMLLVGFATLGVTALAATGLPVGIPLHFPFLFLALLTSVLQALVFTVLSTIYFLLMLPHEHHGEEGEAHPAH